MEVNQVIYLLCLVVVQAKAFDTKANDVNNVDNSENPANVFKGVYTECFFQLSYTCLQKKTLLYLKELNRLSEISVIGDYVKFVKLNISENNEVPDDIATANDSEELAFMIDHAVDNFFNNHLLRFSSLNKDVMMPNEVEEFIGRKKRKGGGGGGHGGDDGGKKKMMMMAMMCMKMKLMMMVPAMMGMMGMMSFKGMMFSMMSFMISKMMLLMKILEKKGGGGGTGGGDGGWAASGGGGAWMPAGGQDYGGGGYDANGQWQSRSIFEHDEHEPIISYVKPVVRYSNREPNKNEVIKVNTVKTLSRQRRDFNENYDNLHQSIEFDEESNMKRTEPESERKGYLTDLEKSKLNESIVSYILRYNKESDAADQNKVKSRRKRGLLDVLQSAYLYWNRIMGLRQKSHPKYKIMNGIKYVYYPMKQLPKMKAPKELTNVIKVEEPKPVLVAEDFNKGEIVEGPVENRMIKKKIKNMKNSVQETVEDNPWE